MASSGYSVNLEPSITVLIKNIFLLSLLPVLVEEATFSPFPRATWASLHTLAAYSVFPEPIGPIRRTLRPGVVKSKCWNVSWTSSVGNPKDLRKSAPGVTFSVFGIWICFLDDFDSSGASKSRSAGLDHGDSCLTVPYSTGCFYSESVSNCLSHKSYVLNSGPAL